MNDDIQQPQPEEQERGSPPSAGKKTSKLAPFVALVAVGGIVLTAFVIGLAIAFSFIKWREPAPVTYVGGYSGGSLGCTVPDDFFKDTTTALYGNDDTTDGISKAADEIINKAGSMTVLANEKVRLVSIITRAREKALNPLILVAIWNGEQGYKSPDKAFGCGNFSDGEKDNGFDTTDQTKQPQLTCALKRMTCAVYGTDCDMGGENGDRTWKLDYSTPRGGDLFTRFFYHYTGAMLNTYTLKHFVADEKNPRINILQKLVPDQVTCIDGLGINGLLAGSYSNSKWNKTFMTKAELSSWLTQRKLNTNKKLIPTGWTLHWTGGSSAAGAYGGMAGRDPKVFVHFMVDYNGTVYQLMPLNLKQAGSGSGVDSEGKSANGFTLGIEIVGTGESDLLSHPVQQAAVVSLINEVSDKLKIEKVRGNTENFKASKGIFGHFQTGGGDNYIIGCSSNRKADPGKEYLKEIWDKVGAPPGTGCGV